ncbi:vacuolar protein-sorting-associated protein 25 [Patescibacteria group bacterium]|nr:vacuolar protein-sorting-associated protein 25 [Patescibacteria group bacterium]
MNEQAARVMLQQLITAEYGEWEGGATGQRIHAHISWKNIHTWADELYQWADKHGEIGNIITLYDLQQGDNTKGQGTECHDVYAYLFSHSSSYTYDMMVTVSLFYFTVQTTQLLITSLAVGLLLLLLFELSPL